ncbi:shikimate dehydrogenase family protein [Chryseobacterium sp. A321]
MELQANYGLVGKGISYSFSQKYFTQKFRKLFLKNYNYFLLDLEDLSHIKERIQKENLKGFNVTIPYKEQIIPFLDGLSPEAKEIGAVNTVKITGGQWVGYNTDAYGFEKTLELHRKKHHNSALILGNGGAAKAVKYVLDKLEIPYQVIERKSSQNFESLTKSQVESATLIVQCTPVGTYPDLENSVPFPFEALGTKHLVIDLIYNPEYTQFIKKASDQGAKCLNGYFMLEQQAEKAWTLWNKSLP